MTTPARTRTSLRLRRAALVLLCAAAAVLAWQAWPPAIQESLRSEAIRHREGHSYEYLLGRVGRVARARSDSAESPAASRLALMEDGRRLGPAHEVHQKIATAGAGAYSHWENMVIFSASDNSDPRANGRRYEAHYELVPARWLLGSAALALFAAIAYPLARLLQSTTKRPGTVATRAALSTLVGIAALATSTHWIAFRGEIRFPLSELASTSVVGIAPLAAQAGAMKIIAFERLVAPFLIIPSGNDGPQGGYLRITQRGAPLREVFDLASLEDSKDAAFLDADRIGGEGAMAYLPPQALQGDAPLVVSYRFVVTPTAVAALWALCGIAMTGALVARRLRGRPARERALLAAGAALGAAGLLLLALNVAGMAVPPRLAEPPVMVESKQLSSERRSAWLPVEALRREVAPRPGEGREEYAVRMTMLVDGNVRHIWNYANASKVGLHVPPWSNYVLWFLGETNAQLYRYHYAAWRPALERGVGMCSQATLILVGILREQGYDARIVQLSGHTIVTAEVSPGRWYVLDPDYGAVLRESLETVERNPEIARGIYERALANRGQGDPQVAAGTVVGFYGSRNYVEPKDGNEMLGDGWTRREKWAAWLKWIIPAVLLAIAALLAGLGRRAEKRRRIPQTV